MTIAAERCLYIRLGKCGEWTAQCIVAGELRLDYPHVSHEFALDGRWTQVESQLAELSKDRESSARHAKQIRAFYEASASTLWITFHADCMWWSFAAPGATQRADGTKVRSTVDGWHQYDVGNQPLAADRLSGGLLAVQAYRGTICAVESGYVLQVINCVDAPRFAAAGHAFAALIDSLQPIVERLHPRDLEVLVDLIFRNAGWQRVGVLAETETDIDLALESAVTGERIAVEVKAHADVEDYREYAARYRSMVGFDRFYFVTHSLIDTDVARESAAAAGTGIQFWGSQCIAQRAAQSGLAQWLIDKAT
jgi:restriction endonuclease